MKKEEYTLVNGQKSYIITAEDGMILVRNDGTKCGQSISLGYRYRDKDGNVLEEAKFETPDDYTEEQITDEEKEIYNNK